MQKLSFSFLVGCLLLSNGIIAQPDRWQQKIKYTINVNMNVATNQFSGTEKIDYFNQSPDTLTKVFMHLYWNAFQPNSSMDVRSRELGKTKLADPRRNNDGLDWDARVKDRISKLKPDEIGYQNVKSVLINGVAQKLIEHETILEIVLAKPILPKSKITLDVAFEAQVPVQIRRSGRDNAEGIRYSMAQWYPKVVEYDYQGWHANPYIAREFYGVWGDFDVNITIDKKYLVTAGGDFKTAVIGVMLGAQWELGEHFALDWWIIGAGFGGQKGTFSAVGDFSNSDIEDIKTELASTDADFPGSFKSTVTSSKVEIEYKSGFPAIRGFGLCLGYKF